MPLFSQTHSNGSESSISVLCLVPDFLGPPGGIARYCRLLHAVLRDTTKQLLILALNDERIASYGELAAVTQQDYRACGRSRQFFLWHAVTAAVRMRPDIILVGHAHFALVGWLLGRLCGARVIVMAY